MKFLVLHNAVQESLKILSLHYDLVWPSHIQKEDLIPDHLDDRELDLLFEYGKVTQDHNVRIEFLNFLAQHCEGQGISFSEEKIKYLINKVNNPEPEPKKETSAKQMVALPDGTSADIMDTSH